MRLRRIPEAKAAVTASELCLKEPLEMKGRWREQANGKPVYLEVGMGRGAFIIGNALAEPDKLFLGLEIREEMLYLAERKLQREMAVRGLFEYPDNVRFLWTNAKLLPELFEAGEIDRIYLNFSDPWPKAKHDKRRLTYKTFWEQYLILLRDGGELFFRTDNEKFFDWSLESFAESPFINLSVDRNAPIPENGVISEYEARYRGMGNPIFTAVYKKGETK